VGKYHRSRQATDKKMHMCIACWIPKAEDTHSGYVTLYFLLFHGNNICTNLTQCYVLRTFLSCYFIKSILQVFKWLKFRTHCSKLKMNVPVLNNKALIYVLYEVSVSRGGICIRHILKFL
jgi:hypothetical protein